jgi:hypothetical protein
MAALWRGLIIDMTLGRNPLNMPIETYQGCRNRCGRCCAGPFSGGFAAGN